MHFKTCTGYHRTSSMQESYIIGVAIRTTRNTVSCGWQLLNRSMENTTRIFIAVAEIKKCADMGIDIVCVLAMLMCDPVIIFYIFFYLYSSICWVMLQRNQVRITVQGMSASQTEALQSLE